MTQNTTHEKINRPMLAVYAATLGVLLVYYAATTTLFLKSRILQNMRRRTMLPTVISVVFIVLTTIYYLLAAPLRMYISCSASLWTSYLLLPTGILTMGTRMFNLAAVRRSHEAAVLHVEESVAAQEIDVQRQLAERQPAKLGSSDSQQSGQLHPWASHPSAEALEEGKRHTWSLSNNSMSPDAYVPLDHSTHNTAFAGSRRRHAYPHETFALNRWFLHHLDLCSVKSLLTYLVGYMIAALIYTCVVQFVSFGNGTGVPLRDWPHNDCEQRWEHYPLYGLFFSLIFIGMISLVLLLLRQNMQTDALEMRNHGRELWLGTMMWIFVVAVYSAAALSAGHATPADEARLFPFSNLIVIACFIDHVLTIAWPTYRVYADPNNAGWRNLLTSTTNHAKTVQVTGSRAQFRKLLLDTKRFREFKLFSIRNMSVENAFFYDACRSLLRSAELHEAALREGNADPGYDERLGRRLAWLHSTFLRASADMEVNLSGSTRRRLERATRDGMLDIPMMRKAMHEVEELMFYDTYQRYLRQHGDEPDNDVCTSMTEITAAKP
ncbi:hypothetical protein SYNPS1DRAFT_29584 [Syncephalis pseudoplumigaleata]|uniref:RGS domain-containing protein n=1 Tax=Syncephalis pseudoplumigaleata TaxID=1712513 RepID=A0A4P9Z014_9FUNG|nr:hypothetical protein SYNPS1DRAFT_29584 [Syncephalis pseudoplumigaleata]|eukprot:RKP24660.1 hypothetical protein SYNPS1DRAFT_29584 [Syncephalis pseudoplumigaleata]